LEVQFTLPSFRHPSFSFQHPFKPLRNGSLVSNDVAHHFCCVKINLSMKHKFLFFLLLAASVTLKAQQTNNSYHRIGILAGGQQTQLLDLQFSPLIYKANEWSAEIYFDAGHNRSDWHADLSVSRGALFPPAFADRKIYNTTEDIYGTTTTDSFFVRGNTLTAVLQFGYEYAFVQRNKWSVSAGAAFREQLMYPSTFTNAGTMNAASLLASATIKYKAGENNTLSASIAIPVAGFNSRFPYSGTVSLPNQTLLKAFFEGGTEFVFLDQYQQINVTMNYRHKLSEHWGLGAQYDFMWLHYALPLPLKSFANRFAVTLDYNF
jgi:hypothetical protein